MLKKQLKETATILFNILNQPLEISGASQGISFLQASMDASSQSPEHSDLRKLLWSLATHPGPTEVLIREIDLLSQELVRD